VSVWDDIVKALGTDADKMAEKWFIAIAVRHDMEEYQKHGTRFCRSCGWRSDLNVYCNSCAICEQCRYPNSRCKCNDPNMLKHAQAVLDEIRQKNREDNANSYKGYRK
jgi:hypothetical protein